MADRTTRFSNWFQIISNVAIIVGLGLVIYELNQSKELALGQMAEATVARMSDRNLAIMGENPQEALAKAALFPGDLDEKDTVILDAFYDHVVTNWIASYQISQVVGADRGWRTAVLMEVPQHFSSDPGRRWLRAWASGVGDEFGMSDIAKLALKAVGDGSDNYLRSNYELLLAKDRS